MKNSFAVILMSFIACSYLYAQNIKQKKAYTYSAIYNLDSNNNVVGTQNVNGLIVFSTAENKEFMTILIGGNTTLYNGEITMNKRESTSSTGFVNVYLVLYYFQGNKVPLQIFEFFDTSISSVIPQMFIVNILNAQTAKVVRGQSFSGIKRVR